MSIKNKLENKYLRIINRVFYKFEPKELFDRIANNKSDRTIYLFCNPTHSNLGDQAQTYCILNWFAEYFPGYSVICAPKRITPPLTLELIRQRIKQHDLVFIHSGYLIFDPHPELSYICDVVSLFHDKQVVILPQTVNLIEEGIKSKVVNTFNNHPDLVLLCRDDISLDNAQGLFPKAKLILWPDFVTSLIGTRSYNSKRRGILFCLRNDGEKFYSDEDLNKLKSSFSNVKITTSDTTILKSPYAWKFRRAKLINEVLESFSKYQLVITDRYHGTIFSQIASTPVIVLSSSDHKLSSGVKWFPKQYFEQNVFFAKNLDEAYQIGLKILERKGEIIENSTYFKEEYFSKLKSILKG
jgi:exopolysaccharide biosynthesis predicted pyruvyltransferase EpsI